MKHIIQARHFILVMFILVALNLNAKNEIDSLRAEATRWQAPWQLYSNYFDYNPAATFAVPVKHFCILDASYTASHADAGMHRVQDGNGTSSFLLNSESFQVSGPLRFFGSATYSTGVRKKVGWCDVDDYQLLSPYLVADSVGGDYKNETYAFNGGVSYISGCWEYGIRAGYEGGVSYRQVDPRPLNTTSVIRINPGIVYQKGNWQLGAFGQYERYRQNVDIEIEKTDRKIYFHLLEGFGIYNKQFSALAESFTRNYKGNIFNGGIQASYGGKNHSTGLMIQTSNAYLQADEDDRRTPYKIEHHQIEAKLSHENKILGKSLFLSGDYLYHQVIGNETQYQPQTINSTYTVWVFATQSDRYQSRTHQAHFSALLADKNVNRFSVWEQLDAIWKEEKQNYYYPYYHQEVQNLTSSASVGINSPGKLFSFTGNITTGYRKNLKASLGQDDNNILTAQLLLPDYAFLTSDVLFYQLQAGVDFPVSVSMLADITANAGLQTSGSKKAWTAVVKAVLHF